MLYSTSNSTISPSPGQCSGGFWKYDDFENCHRQQYLEYIPLTIFLICGALWTLQKLVLHLFFAKPDPRYDEQQIGSDVEFHPSDVPDPNALITIRSRTIGDRMRLMTELLLNCVQSGLVIYLYTDSKFRQHYNEFAPRVPLLLLLCTLHVLALSLYRFVAAKRLGPLVANPFAQQAFFYTLFTTVYTLNWYSQLGYSYSTTVSQITVCLLITSIANWVILYTSPLGDHAARLYTTKGVKVPRTIPSTEPTSSLLTIMTCSWCWGLIKTAQKKPLDKDDVLDLEEDDHVFSFLERSKLLPQRWSFFVKLAVTLRKPIFLNILFGCSASFLKLTPTLLIQKILEFLEDRSVPKRVAWLYVFSLGLTYLVSNVVGNQAFYQGRKLSVGLRSLIIGYVYRKALFQRTGKNTEKKKEDSDSDSDSSSPSDTGDTPDNNNNNTEDEVDNRVFDTSNTGAIINLMSVDAFKVAEFSAYLHDVPSTPLLVVLSIGFLYSLIGWSAFVSVAVMVAFTPLNVYLAKRLNDIQDQLMAVTDRRIEKTNELLDAIRIVKFYAWENRFTDRVLQIRDEELSLLLWRYIFWIANALLFFLIPILVVVSSFWCFVRYQGGTLTTSIAFTALSIFNILRMPLNELAYIFTELSSSIVSLRRIQKYLEAEETSKYDQLTQTTVGEEEILGFDNASFNWSSPRETVAAAAAAAAAARNGTTFESAAATDTFKLRNIDLRFVIEDLNVIVGPTGSGKTSLLLALLGEMTKESGTVYLPQGDRRMLPVNPETGLTNSVAYCPQEAWLVNDTIKNNILFAHKYDKQRYNDVLDACELRRDLEILEKGDQTLIGDKGIALSGGQKQRVSLARAVYSNSRHLILDDCLSAVDSHTAESLYQNALNGVLAKNRTIILVSHNIALTIGQAAKVVVVKNGRITAQGTPSEVAQSGHLGEDELINKNAQSAAASRVQSASDLASLAQYSTTAAAAANADTAATTVTMGQEVNELHNPVVQPPPTFIVEEDMDPAVLEEEARATGSVSLATYMSFLRELASLRGLIIIGILACLVPFVEYLESWWVKLWAASSEKTASGVATGFTRFFMLGRGEHATTTLSAFGAGSVDPDTLANLKFYSAGYIILGVSGIVIGVMREFIIYYGGLQAARKIFKKLLISVVHAKTRFHDSTPSGRIVNRFSKDMEVIDQQISADLLWFVIALVDGLQVTFVVSYVTPLLIPIAVIVIYLFILIGKAYLAAARELKRLESISRSPIFQQFGETLTGSVVIRAYGDTERFILTNWGHVDETHRPYFWLWVTNRWLSLWCSVLSLFICVLAAVLIVAASDRIDPGFAGISLSFSIYFGECILWIVRMYAQCEVSMNSVERVAEYLEIEQEAPGIIPESRPPAHWPSAGKIVFKNLSLRYADDLPMVIKNVSFEVPGGKKVGIVGRTGAGKSTIITAMLRMLEPSTGTVLIDDVDITSIGLEDLRNGLSIIPQDPTLFKGTLRSNIDLFNQYSDDAIFKALAHAHLVPENTTAAKAAEAIANHSSDHENLNPFYDLSHSVTEGGRNLSQGQRQLLCLARAILKEPRILLLDEATASIDYETDKLIQETIRSSFSDTTILTIAHRLRTIADYDIILVLEKGEVAQFGHPSDLLDDKSGIFYGMCEKSGELESLIQLAKSSKEKIEQTTT